MEEILRRVMEERERKGEESHDLLKFAVERKTERDRRREERERDKESKKGYAVSTSSRAGGKGRR